MTGEIRTRRGGGVGDQTVGKISGGADETRSPLETVRQRERRSSADGRQERRAEEGKLGGRMVGVGGAGGGPNPED